MLEPGVATKRTLGSSDAMAFGGRNGRPCPLPTAATRFAPVASPNARQRKSKGRGRIHFTLAAGFGSARQSLRARFDPEETSSLILHLALGRVAHRPGSGLPIGLQPVSGIAEG